MWPWGHLAVGYLAYVATVRARGRRQTGAAVAAVAIGSQLPDLIDKPLAWTVAVLPSGRSLGHSLLFVALLAGVGYLLARRARRTELAVAFAVGHAAHALVDLGPDVVLGLLRGDASQLRWTTYMLWPLLPSPPYPSDSSFAGHVLGYTLDAYAAFEIGLFGVAVAVWLRSGAPGLAVAGRRLRAARG